MKKCFFLELKLDPSSPKSSRQCHEKDRVIHKLLNLVENTLQNGRNSEILSGVSSAVLCLDHFLGNLLFCPIPLKTILMRDVYWKI